MEFDKLAPLIQQMIDAFAANSIPPTGKYIALNNCCIDIVEALERRFGLRVAVVGELQPNQIYIMDADQFEPEAFVTDAKYKQRD